MNECLIVIPELSFEDAYCVHPQESQVCSVIMKSVGWGVKKHLKDRMTTSQSFDAPSSLDDTFQIQNSSIDKHLFGKILKVRIR